MKNVYPALALLLSLQALPAGSVPVYPVVGIQTTGEVPSNCVAVTCRQDGEVQYVVGKIRICQPPEKVWPILANPYEFEENISPRFKTIAVLADKPDMCVLRCKVDMGLFFPPIKYTVESHFFPNTISFQSTEGDLRDFRGKWEVTPAAGGSQSDVTYSLFVVPGIPIPQWIVNQGVKMELPHTLSALRKRVEDICNHRYQPVHRTITAAACPQ
jgi:Polyketide cyclase / dehydrase and lipid transport